MREHGPPGGPVVSPLRPPDIQLIVNAFLVQYPGKAAVGFGVFMVATTRNQVNMAASANLFQDGLFGQIRNLSYGHF